MILHGSTLKPIVRKIKNLNFHPKGKYAVFEEKHLEQIKKDLREIGHSLYYAGKHNKMYLFKMTEKETEQWKE